MTLSIASHATAGGGLPSGAAAALLALLSATLGMLVVSVPASADVKVLLALLALGQILAHAVLGAGGHAHSAATAPWELMVAAHVAAVMLGAALIAVGGHLCATVSHVLRARPPPTRRPVAAVSPVVLDSADQPLRSALSLAASMSHRGPPVSLAR